MSFPCDKCGLCCKNIDKIPQLKPFDDGNGTCIHLRGNLCSIYDSRPDICNVDVMYEKYYKSLYTKTEFYNLNQQGCIKLKESSSCNIPQC